MIEIVTLFYV